MGKEQRIGLDTIDGGRFTSPAEPAEVLAATPTEEPEPITPSQNTRWLYDSDDDYTRAQKKLAAEIALEKKKKELAKKVRIERAKKVTAGLRARLKPAASTLIPKITGLARRVLTRRHRKKLLIGTGGLTILLVLFAWSSQSNLHKGSSQVLSESASPAFDTLAPGNDTKQTTSGQIAYDKGKRVASFTDTIDDVPLTVSQQALPERFKKDPASELGKFAEDINAKEKLQIGNLTAYSGVSEKGPQTVVLIKNNVLVFITANKKLPTAQLIGYIDALK